MVSSMQVPTSPFPTASTILHLWKYKWLLLITAAVAGVGTYLYAISQPEYFKSSINCVPPKTDQSALGNVLGGMSSTLRDFGLTKLGAGKGDSYDFIVLLFSRSIRDSMIRQFDLVNEYELQGKRFQLVRDEFDDNIEIELHPEGNYEISIWSRDPKKAVTMCSTFVAMANELANRVARDEAARATTYLERRLRSMDSSIAAIGSEMNVYSKKYLLFSPEDQAKSTAGALADLKASVMKQESILGLLQQTYGTDDPQTKTQRSLVEELRRQMKAAQSEPGFAGNFAITDVSGLGASYMKLYAELEAMLKVKAFLTPTLEQARLDQHRNTTSLLIVDEPVPAEKRDRPKRLLMAAGAAFGVDVLIIMVLLAMRGFGAARVAEEQTTPQQSAA